MALSHRHGERPGQGPSPRVGPRALLLPGFGGPVPCPEGPAPWTRGGTASQIAPKLVLEGPSAPRPLRPRERGGVAPGSPGCRGVLGASAVAPAQAVVALAESVAIVWAATKAQGQIPSATPWWAGLGKGACQDASHHPVLQPCLWSPEWAAQSWKGLAQGRQEGRACPPWERAVCHRKWQAGLEGGLAQRGSLEGGSVPQ